MKITTFLQFQQLPIDTQAMIERQLRSGYIGVILTFVKQCPNNLQTRYYKRFHAVVRERGGLTVDDIEKILQFSAKDLGTHSDFLFPVMIKEVEISAKNYFELAPNPQVNIS